MATVLQPIVNELNTVLVQLRIELSGLQTDADGAGIAILDSQLFHVCVSHTIDTLWHSQHDISGWPMHINMSLSECIKICIHRSITLHQILHFYSGYICVDDASVPHQLHNPLMMQLPGQSCAFYFITFGWYSWAIPIVITRDSESSVACTLHVACQCTIALIRDWTVVQSDESQPSILQRVGTVCNLLPVGQEGMMVSIEWQLSWTLEDHYRQIVVAVRIYREQRYNCFCRCTRWISRSHRGRVKWSPG